eukprot:4516358-Pyramimonas_sp.AAC.1
MRHVRSIVTPGSSTRYRPTSPDNPFGNRSVPSLYAEVATGFALRARPWLLRIVTCSEDGRRMVALVDNLPLALSCATSRARSKHLRSCLNQLCSLSLATGSRLSVRWVASERSPPGALPRG